MYKISIHITLLLVLFAALLLSVPAEAIPITSPVSIGSTSPEFSLVSTSDMALTPRTKIPEAPVRAYITRGHHTRFKLFFIDIRYGYDLVDFEYYKAWCLQKNRKLRRNAMHQVSLYDCYDPSIPVEFRNMDWNRINYVINHKTGPKSVVQEAIWYFSDKGNKQVSIEASRLIEEAVQKGADYRPAPGDLVAIVCRPENGQAVLIEYTLPQNDVFDVTPAFYDPGTPVALPPATSIPAWLPLFAILPVVPELIPSDPPPQLLILPLPPIVPQPPSLPVPEPSSLQLLGCGLALILASGKIRQGRK